MTQIQNSPEATKPLSLLYDGDCPMCQGVVAKLTQCGFVNGIQVSPLQDCPWATPELWERGRVEVLLVEPNTMQIWGGVDALSILLKRKKGFSFLGWLLSTALGHALAHWIYQIVAYNRRILSPRPLQAIPCTCDPPDNPAMTQRLYGVLILVLNVSLIGFAFGVTHSPAHLTLLTPLPLFKALFTAMAIGFALSTLALGVTLSQQIRQLYPQTLVSLTGSSLYLLLAGFLCLWLRPHPGNWQLGTQGILLLGLGIQTVGLIPMLWKRLRTLGAPVWSPWLWLVTYLVGAVGFVAFAFH